MGNLKSNPRLQAQVLAVLLRRLGAVDGRAITIHKDELPSNPHSILSRFIRDDFQISYEDKDEASKKATVRGARKSIILSIVRRNDDSKRYVARTVDDGPAWLIYDQREERHLEDEGELLAIDPHEPLKQPLVAVA